MPVIQPTSGNPTPTVQWQVSTDNGSTWNNVSGATSTTYSFTAQSSDNGKQYHAVFTNFRRSAATNSATLSRIHTAISRHRPAGAKQSTPVNLSVSAAASEIPPQLSSGK
jgi:Zn-finger domain-containing protein